MVGLLDDFWVQKGESGKGRKKHGAKSCGKNSILPNHFQSPTHIPSRRTQALTFPRPLMDGRDGWVAGFLSLLGFLVHRAFKTPEIIIIPRGVAFIGMVDY